MTKRLAKYLATLAPTDLQRIYRDARLMAIAQNETIAEFDDCVIADAPQDNILQTTKLTENAPVACSYIALIMLRHRPDCQALGHREAIALWIEHLSKVLEVAPGRASLIVYGSLDAYDA